MKSLNTRFGSSLRRFVVGASIVTGVAVGSIASESTAAAQVVDIQIAPPAPRVEVVGRPPSSRHFWIPGYWAWNGGRHEWVGGRWEVTRAGWGWENPVWVHHDHGWRFAPGHWRRR
jgi:hypothetical protein